MMHRGAQEGRQNDEFGQQRCLNHPSKSRHVLVEIQPRIPPSLDLASYRVFIRLEDVLYPQSHTARSSSDTCPRRLRSRPWYSHFSLGQVVNQTQDVGVQDLHP